MRFINKKKFLNIAEFQKAHLNSKRLKVHLSWTTLGFLAMSIIFYFSGKRNGHPVDFVDCFSFNNENGRTGLLIYISFAMIFTFNPIYQSTWQWRSTLVIKKDKITIIERHKGKDKKKDFMKSAIYGINYHTVSNILYIYVKVPIRINQIIFLQGYSESEIRKELSPLQPIDIYIDNN
jgi:hypothetical protein